MKEYKNRWDKSMTPETLAHIAEADRVTAEQDARAEKIATNLWGGLWKEHLADANISVASVLLAIKISGRTP